jgi:hypothetical protein
VADFSTEVYFPNASSVILEGDFGCHALSTSDGEHWICSIRIPEGRFRYRFRVDHHIIIPDPFNSRYEVDDKQRYFSVWDTELEPEDDFPEESLGVMASDRTTPYGPFSHRSDFGPSSPHISALLGVKRMRRKLSHVAWVWTSASRTKTLVFERVIEPTSVILNYIDYHSIPDYGRWSVSCYLNGRLAGLTSVRVGPLVYSDAGAQAGARTG